MFEDQENKIPVEKPTVKPKPNQSEIVQIRINSFTNNPRHPVPPQAALPSCSTFTDVR